ncbi:hypothetical protein MYU51_005417 [Penicillium brevicompactum]
MSKNSFPTSDCLKVKPSSITSKSTDFGRNNAGPRASSIPEPKPVKKSSYMLDQWKASSPSSDPWSSARATLSRT